MSEVLNLRRAGKSNLTASVGQSQEDFADYCLKRAFDLFSVEHDIKPRDQAPGQDSSGISTLYKQVLGSAYEPSMLTSHSSIQSSGMPMLTFKGFLDITACEVLPDPSREWGNFSRVVRKYNLPQAAWGEMPRSVLPELPDQRMVQKITQITAQSYEQGKRALAATNMRLQLEAQGQQNVIDLFDDRRYYYTYR